MIGWVVWTEFIASGEGSGEGSCERGNEPSSYVKYWEFFSSCTNGDFSRRPHPHEVSLSSAPPLRSWKYCTITLFRSLSQIRPSLVNDVLLTWQKTKVNTKLSLGVMRKQTSGSVIFKFGTIRSWMLSFTPQLLYLQGKSPGTDCIGGWMGRKGEATGNRIQAPHKKKTDHLNYSHRAYTDSRSRHKNLQSRHVTLYWIVSLNIALIFFHVYCLMVLIIFIKKSMRILYSVSHFTYQCHSTSLFFPKSCNNGRYM
jgi:hypothetical protein